ncbi:MAG: hypothetical protein MJB12_04895, partial [Firmicutes bacterium]|nr:hypothetical protein [Bacillota bacterium]
PESAGAIAKFCKDNHIEVEMYQFCNEPYFFDISNNKKKFHFNNGLDYAKKMKPFADAILAADPDAKLTLSYSWDTNNGKFREGIAKYPNPYWDIVSIHSYAPYGPNDKDINVGMKKANAGLTYSTSAEAMKEQFKVSWPDAPVMLTEFNVWNGALERRMYNGIYFAEYVMRMSANPNISYVGMHALSVHAFNPVNSYSKEMLHAYDTGTPLDVDSLTLGIEYSVAGLGLKVLNDAVNHSTYTWDSTVEGGVDVDSYVRPLGGKMDTNKVVKMPALYAKAYKGDNGKNYLLVTNKSDIPHNVAVQVDNNNLTAAMTKTYIGHWDPGAKTGLAIMSEATDNPVHIPSYSVVRLEWDADTVPAPPAPRIYDFKIGNGEA